MDAQPLLDLPLVCVAKGSPTGDSLERWTARGGPNKGANPAAAAAVAREGSGKKGALAGYLKEEGSVPKGALAKNLKEGGPVGKKVFLHKT